MNSMTDVQGEGGWNHGLDRIIHREQHGPAWTSDRLSYLGKVTL